MPSAIAVAARVMSDDLFRLNVVSQNLANANTAGYKKELVTTAPFVAHLQAGLDTIRVGLPSLGSVVDTRQGTLTQTGNALDLALEGSGFFELAGAEGPLYTRQGSFRLDGAGRLVTPAGLPIMGTAGEITLSGTQPSIDKQGRVFEGDRQVAQLKILRFADASRLTPLGGGLYRSDASGELQTEALQVRQGFVESSNVVALSEMVRMIELARRFEAATRVLQSYDSMLGGAIKTLGEF